MRAVLGKSSSNVFRGMAILATGGGIGRLISIAAIPALTRLYSPQDFGVLSVFTALVAILTPLATLRYSLALPLPRSVGTAMNLLALSLVLMGGFCFALALLLWLFGTQIFHYFSVTALAPWWWLIAIGTLAAATYDLLSSWATRERAYRIIATTNIWQNAAGSLVKILLGLAMVKPGGLLIGQVVTQGGGTTSLVRGFLISFRANWHFVRWTRIRQLAKLYRSFPIYRAPSQLLMVASQQLPLLFMAALYDIGTTGQFGLALMALALPVSLLANTTANAFYAEAARLGVRRPAEIRGMLHSVLIRLAIIALPPALVLFFAGEWLIPIFLGPAWHQTAAFAATMSIYMLFQFVQAPVAHIFYLFDGLRALLFLNIQRIALILVIFAVAYWLDLNAGALVLLYSILLGLHYGLSIIYAMRFIPEERR